MFVPLEEAVAGTCGGKAGALGALLRADLPVPDGFVVPLAVHRAAVRDYVRGAVDDDGPDAIGATVDGRSLPPSVVTSLERALVQLGDPAVAVRSSAADEDTGEASAAGQYASILAVRGVADVVDAVLACWASLYSSRAAGYRVHADGGTGAGDPAMAVIVQRHLDAEVSGVMFTPAGRNEPTVIEASWGLGPSVVAGTVTPDAYRVHPDGTTSCVVADKPTRLDRVGTRLLAREVPVEDRRRPTLDEADLTALATLGTEVASTLGGPQDIEWIIVDGRSWLVQARPVTAPPPTPPSTGTSTGLVTLTGTPGSRGTATGTARTVRGPQDFARVGRGDILVCPFTDPAWTPLLRIAGGVVTQIGGALSHAAIVARERGIPAVLSVAEATTTIPDGAVVTIDGTAGTVTTHEAEPRPPAH